MGDQNRLSQSVSAIFEVSPTLTRPTYSPEASTSQSFQHPCSSLKW